MTIITVSVTGLDAVERLLDPMNLEQGLHVGLSKSGGIIAAQARAIIRPHHYTGHYEQQIHTVVTGTGLNQVARVGVSASQVPEARPLSYGWRSGSGKMPPIEPIARWLAKHPDIGASPNSFRNASGFRRTSGSISSVASESAVRGLAFVIARSIARKGYSFQPLKVWETAFQRSQSQIAVTILRALRWRAT